MTVERLALGLTFPLGELAGGSCSRPEGTTYGA